MENIGPGLGRLQVGGKDHYRVQKSLRVLKDSLRHPFARAAADDSLQNFKRDLVEEVQRVF